MLAARAAAEIVVGDQDLGVAIGRLVEHEIRILGAVGVIARLGEQALAEPGALDRLEVLLGMIMSVSTLMIFSGAATLPAW